MAVAVSKVCVEERDEVGALIGDGPVGVDSADQLLHGVGREAEHAGRLWNQGLEVGEGSGGTGRGSGVSWVFLFWLG